LYRGINEFKKGYQPRINIIKEENGNLLADPQSVLNRWKNFFNQVLNVHAVHDVRQMDIHTAEPLVPEPSLVNVEIAIGKLKSYKSPGTDQIPAEMIKAEGETLCSVIHFFVLHGIRRNYRSSGRNLLLYQFIKRVIRLSVIIIDESPSY
jgi:prolipoprotein diacylglyceryltransferase